MPFSVAQRTAILNAIWRGDAYTPPTALWLSVHTANPGDTGASEKTGDGMARVQVRAGAGGSMSTAVTAAITNASAFTFPANSGGASYTVTHWGLWTLSAGGVWVGGDVLAASRTIPVGINLVIPVGDLDGAAT